eukprot:m.335685 g.335685  ORF g.335685 m.335685 type:complete len:232 (+) comp17650_c0_seq1:127-822(+)
MFPISPRVLCFAAVRCPTIPGAGHAVHNNVNRAIHVSTTLEVKRRERSKPNKKVKMAVILRENIPTLGPAGSMQYVKRGYARNYLLPQGLAVYATPENKAVFLQEDESSQTSNLNFEDEKVAKFLSNKSLIFKKKEGSSFEIRPNWIAYECSKQLNLKVTAARVQLASSITDFGDHKADIILNETLVVPLSVTVRPTEEEEPETLTRLEGYKHRMDVQKENSWRRKSQARE